MNANVFIYTLSDPNGVIRYIGKSVNPKNRLSEHITESKSGKPARKNNWIKFLLKNNQKPTIDIIDIVPSNNWEFWEQHWISNVCNGKSLSSGGFIWKYD